MDVSTTETTIVNKTKRDRVLEWINCLPSPLKNLDIGFVSRFLIYFFFNLWFHLNREDLFNVNE